MSNVIDVLSRVNPAMRAVLDKQQEATQSASATDVSLAQMRQDYIEERQFWNEGGPVPAKVFDDIVPHPGRDIPVRYYYPTEGADLPAIIYLHGGGFMVGNLNTHDRIMRSLARQTGAVVVGVDYSLSPEAKFPTAIEECAAVAAYLHTKGTARGVAPEHLAFAGDSAGAHLSLATTLYLREQIGDSSYIRCLLLYYGMYGLKDSVSGRLYGGEWDGMAQADRQSYIGAYLGDPQDATSPYFDCFQADLMRDVPPCYISAAELDPLRDDSHAFAAILEEGGVPHQLEVVPGVLHAFLHYSRMLPEARTALDNGAAFYRHHVYGEASPGVQAIPGRRHSI